NRFPVIKLPPTADTRIHEPSRVVFGNEAKAQRKGLVNLDDADTDIFRQDAFLDQLVNRVPKAQPLFGECPAVTAEDERPERPRIPLKILLEVAVDDCEHLLARNLFPLRRFFQTHEAL